MLFIFGNSLKDSSESSEQSFAVKEILMRALGGLGINGDINIALLRNMAHVAEFALLGACLSLLALYFARRKESVSLSRYASFLGASIGTGALVAILDELLQLGSAGRACELKDALLDFLGIIIGTVFACFMYWLFVKTKHCMMQKNK